MDIYLHPYQAVPVPDLQDPVVRDAASSYQMKVRSVAAHDLERAYHTLPVGSAPVHDQEAQFVQGQALGPFQPAEELVKGHTVPMHMENLMLFPSLASFGK
jgi:hypothetical protein